MKLLFLFFLILDIVSHDIQVAHFTISQDEDKVYVDFVFEKEDILETLNDGIAQYTDARMKSYLDNNFSIDINHEPQNIKYSDIDIEDKHIKLRGTLSISTANISSFEIRNTCLLHIDDHSNILGVRIHSQERDFLMNADRTKIQVKY